MSELEIFLQKDSLNKTESVAVSERFKSGGVPVKWDIRAVTEAQNRALRAGLAHANQKSANELDYDMYLLRLCAECTVSPNLKSAELQKAYGAAGETALLEAMLLPGEYAVLLSAVKRINGFDETLARLCEDAKK